MNLTLAQLFLEQRAPKKKAKTPSKLTLEAVYFGNEQLKEVPNDDILKPGDDAVLNSLERDIEAQIQHSVDLEESVTTLDEKMSAGGFEYESRVIQALLAAKATGNITKGAGASAAASDADMNIFGKIFDVEIKLNKDAQMGGSSVRYNRGGEINLVAKLEEDTEALLVAAVKAKKEKVEGLLDFLNAQEPREINGRKSSFPISCTKDAWEAAAKAKKLFNIVIPLDASFIARHYAKKGIYYIQIGGSGLFFLSENPANLPVPKLEGKANLEVRSARGGSKQLASGARVVGAGIRVQGRLKTKNKSPYTLDDPASIQAMLQATKGSTAPKKKQKTPSKKKASNRRRVPVNKSKARG